MKKKLLIEGMKCKHCVANLQDSLTEDIKGVEVLEISLNEQYALINMSEDTKINDVENIIKDLGFNLIGVE